MAREVFTQLLNEARLADARLAETRTVWPVPSARAPSVEQRAELARGRRTA